jgi:hypothetical protein
MHAVPPTVPASTVQEEQRATPGLFGRMMARIRGREGALPMAVAGIARRLKSELRHPLDGFRHEKIAPGGGLVPTLPRQDFSREIDAAFVALVRDRVDALFVFPDPLRHPARPNRRAGGAPCSTCDLSVARLCRGQRADELRNQHCGCVALSRRL